MQRGNKTSRYFPSSTENSNRPPSKLNCLSLVFVLPCHSTPSSAVLNTQLHLLIATSPSTTHPSSSMDESQQPFDTQQDREAQPITIRSQPVTTEKQSTSSAADMDEAKEAGEDKHMDHLTVISDNMETSKYTCSTPAPFLFSPL